MQKKAVFNNITLPYLLLAPQVIITLVFFIWPSLQAIKQSLFLSDAFGLHSYFVWFGNFIDIFTDPTYLNSIIVTLIFSVLVTFFTMSTGLFMARLSNRVIKGKSFYKTLLICPYAVAPAVAGILWRFLFNPAVGVLAYSFDKIGYHWDFLLNGRQAMALIVIAAAWQQFSYNFVFFLAGMQAIPKSLMDAAAIDGAGPIRRFWTIVFPLLSPTTFFLLIMNLLYAFFDTFGIISVVTRGGPANSTDILVYKVYNDGFQGLDFGGSSAQSVILMAFVILLVVVQFRYVEKKVHY